MIENQFSIPFYIFSIEDWKNKKKIILDSLPDFTKYKLEIKFKKIKLKGS